MKFILLLLLICAIVHSQIYEKEYSPLLDQNTSADNPGIFIRLMPTGLAYLREIGMKVVNEQILKMSLPTIREEIENGEVAIHNAYISKYWAPQEYSLDLLDPNMFMWSMSKMHIRVAGDFQASLNNALLLPSVPIGGHFEALLGHVALTISVKLTRNNLGAPQVVPTFCQSNIGYVDLNVRNTGVITDFFINAFKSFLIGNFKPMVEQRMCQMIETIINKDMNGLLSSMPLKVGINENNLDIIGETFQMRKPKSKLGETGIKNLTLLNIVQNLREKNLVLDYRLTSDPFINGGAIAMAAKGEISWQGLGGTPFHPPTTKIPPPHGLHMVEFVGTDYIANSMLFHAYKKQLLDITVGPESSQQLKDLLHTTCDGGFCIGEFLGSLGENYPGRAVEIIFTARKIVRSDTTMTANVIMWINGTKIVGNATIENLDFKLLESKIKDIDQSTFGDLGLFGAEFLEQLLTEILQLGITMPTLDGVVLKSPKLTFHDRYMKVQTYFKLDENYAGDIVQSAVRQTLAHVG